MHNQAAEASAADKQCAGAKSFVCGPSTTEVKPRGFEPRWHSLSGDRKGSSDSARRASPAALRGTGPTGLGPVLAARGAAAAVLVLAWAFGLFRYVSLDSLAEYREALARLVADRPVSAALLYLAAYAAPSRSRSRPGPC